MLKPFISAYSSGAEGFLFISPSVFLCSFEVYSLGFGVLPRGMLT